MLLPPIIWISQTIFGLFAMIINISTFYKEWKKRRSTEIMFTNKYLQIFSFCGILCGALSGFFLFVINFNGFCHIASPMVFSLITCQCGAMGFYQLSRLYYCFSSNKAHSTKGYPTLLFIIMYIIGIPLLFGGIANGWIRFNIFGTCGINNNFEYYQDDYTIVNKEFLNIVHVINLVYTIWDFGTLLLYIFKVMSFKKFKTRETKIYNRIMSILIRIVILTILYQIFAVLWIIISIIDVILKQNMLIVYMLYAIIHCLGSISLCYSMYLMQQHNNKQYTKFLYIFHVCCCYKSMVVYELELYINENKENNNNKTNDNDKNLELQKKSDTLYETHDISVKYAHSKVKPYELSHQTTGLYAKTITITTLK